jgi:hypothetical protein
MAKTVQEIVERLKQSQEAFERQVASIVQDRFHIPPREGEWSAAEIVAHVCESPVFFASSALRMAKEDHPFVGRTPEQLEARLQAISAHAKDGREVALQRLRAANAKVRELIAEIGDEHLSRTGQMPQNKVVTVEQHLESIISHIEAHIQQLKEAAGG